MKILIIGVGGIGSFFVSHLCECIDRGIIESTLSITIADADIVEAEQINYQSF